MIYSLLYHYYRPREAHETEPRERSRQSGVPTFLRQSNIRGGGGDGDLSTQVASCVATRRSRSIEPPDSPWPTAQQYAYGYTYIFVLHRGGRGGASIRPSYRTSAPLGTKCTGRGGLFSDLERRAHPKLFSRASVPFPGHLGY